MLLWYNKEEKTFYFDCNRSEKDLPKEARFWWNKDKFKWQTQSPRVAYKLVQYADKETKDFILNFVNAEKSKLEESEKASSDFYVPTPPGLELMPFQKAGVEFITKRGNTLLADVPGLGKTLQSIGYINWNKDIKKVLIICPASIKINWKRECEKWLTRDLKVGIADGINDEQYDILITNYDSLHKYVYEHDKHIIYNSNKYPLLVYKIRNNKVPSQKYKLTDMKKYPLMNYEYYNKTHAKKRYITYINKLEKMKFDLLVLDESHMIKAFSTIRYKLTKVISKNISRKLFLTGTPILNRPVELYPLLNLLAPWKFNNWKYFVTRYCGAYKGPFGLDVKGSTNQDELRRILKTTIMIRRLKEEVLKELPPKRRQIIELPNDGNKELVEKEKSVNEKWDSEKKRLQLEAALALANDNEKEYENIILKLKETISVSFEEMAAMRKQVAIAKVPSIIEFINMVLENDEKVIVFAHHHEVLDKLYNEFKNIAVKLDGRMNIEDRQVSVDSFQNNNKIKVFVAGTRAAGVGITLTRASIVIFAELDWTPALITQAEDRTHRIGQLNPVIVYHTVFEDSIDVNMAKTLIKKQEIIEAILDKKDNYEEIITEIEDIIPNTETRIKTKILEITDKEQINLIHKVLKILAGFCDGARTKDFIGFNMIDTKVGKELAMQYELTPKQAYLGKMIIKKYHRQITSELFDKIFAEKSDKNENNRS